MRLRLLNTLIPMALGLYSATLAIAASAPPSVDQSPPLQEVTVIGKVDAETLNHEIQQFVQSHARPSALIGQIGRWKEAVCPAVSGLLGAADDLVSRRITTVAHAAGAPTPAPGKQCTANVEVVFTASPQQLLDHIADKYRPLLGFYRVSEHKQIVTFNHPIQAWYMTGTRSLGYLPPVYCFLGCPPPKDGMGLAGLPTAVKPFVTGLQLDSDQSAGGAGSFGASGNAIDHFSHGVRSEFLHVQIIVDSKAVAKYPLKGISDYVAMLALTRLASLDACSGLPSIVNLFATNCAATPATITTADMAYLKGLYGADLDKNLKVELNDMHDGMQRAMRGP